VLPDEGLACGLLLVLLQGSMGPQTQERSLSLRASSNAKPQDVVGVRCVLRIRVHAHPTTEEGTLR